MGEGGKTTAAEVGVKLVVDSNAKAVTDDVAKGLAHVDSEAKKGQSRLSSALATGLGGAKSLAMGFVSVTAAAAALAGGAVIGFAHKSAEAFQESQKQVKEVAGTLAMIDQNGNSFEKIRNYAGDLKDELEEVAIQTGVTDDATVSMFNNIIERGGKSIEAAKELTEEMVYAGRAFPRGPEALAEGFQLLEMGMVRAKNPLVQLIASTKTMKGTAKSVAKEMQKLSVEEQMELAEKAIGKMSEKMKNLPMTMGQMKTSLGVAVENIFEDAGKPIVAGMKPVVAKVREMFMSNKDVISGMASGLGEDIGRGLEIVPIIMDDLFAAWKANSGELKRAVKEITDPLREVFEYVYENRHAFARTIADVTILLVKAGAEIVKAMMAVYETIAKALKWIAKTGVLGGDVARGIGEQEMDAQAKAMRAAVMKDSNHGTGTGAASLADKEAAQQKYMASYSDTYGADKAAEGLARFNATWNRAVEDHNAAMTAAEDNARAARMGDTQSFVAAWKVAAKMQDEGAMTYVSQFLINNKQLQQALAEEGPKILGEGFGALIKTLQQQGSMGGDIASAIQKGARPDLGINPKGNIVQNFNGAINIKQDFRDEDPDRVAVVFREDMAKIGTNRLQSRFATPFGF